MFQNILRIKTNFHIFGVQGFGDLFPPRQELSWREDQTDQTAVGAAVRSSERGAMRRDTERDAVVTAPRPQAHA